MSRKTLLTLFASVMFSAAVAAPHAALAQFGLPPGPPPAFAGPPPGLGGGGPPFGGPPAGLVAGLPPRGPVGAPPRDFAVGRPRFDGATGLRGLDRGGQVSFRGAEGRTNNYARNSYTSHGYRDWRYAAAAAYAYGGSDASSNDGCTYVSTYRRYGTGRVLVCHEN